MLSSVIKRVSVSCMKCKPTKTNAKQLSSKIRMISSGKSSESLSNPELKNENDNTQPKFFNKAQYRFLYPEFLPDANMSQRHWLRERLERADMLARRHQIEIPEFYVGSILRVTVSDPHSPGCTNKFVGICILREESGLRTYFILRNVIDHQGIEIRYDMYNPSIQQIEVLKLEKRLDEHLVYLRDALPEYCTIPFNMELVPHHESELVPINPIKVKLKPLPWYSNWERFNLKGIEFIEQHLRPRDLKLMGERGEKATPWLKYDLMKEYRKSITEEDQAVIWDEVHEHHSEIKGLRKIVRKQKLLNKKNE